MGRAGRGPWCPDSLSRAPVGPSLLTSSPGWRGEWCWVPAGSVGREWGGGLYGCLPSLFPAQHPGETRGSTVLSHLSSDAQTNGWATGRLYKGQDFLEFPRLYSCRKTRPAPPPCYLSPQLLSIAISFIIHPSWDTSESGMGHS